jgi:hypothetical protein
MFEPFCQILLRPGLLAQAAGPEVMIRPNWVGTVNWGLLLVLGIAAAIGLATLSRAAEQRHTERMRALELGRSWPPARRLSPFWTTGWLAAALGLILPFVTLAFASTQNRGFPDNGSAVWLAAAVISVMGIIGATILTLRTASLAVELARLDRQPSAPPVADPMAKPSAVDPDAFDTTARRATVEPVWDAPRPASQNEPSTWGATRA